ncbi:MAG: hypothetical protein R3D84_08000 [Paracoccaceae bacterium]
MIWGVPARLLQSGRLSGTAPEHSSRRRPPFQDAVFYRAQGIFQAADRCVPRHADQPWQVDQPQPLDTGHGCLLWPQHLSGRNLCRLSGGLDSLLEPRGPIKEAQELAARAFGSKQTFFATNGTSTCNKIVVQALVRPGDIVLVDRDCAAASRTITE